MKRFLENLRLLTLLIAASLLVACGGDGGAGDDPDGPETPTTLSASPTTLSFTDQGGTQSLTIASPATWSINSSAAWCYAKQTSGVKGTTTVEVVATANTGKDRSATLTLTASGCNPLSISVSQAAVAEDPTIVKAQPDTWDGVRRSDMIYQLLIYSFADSNGDKKGDFNGITAKMDYIASLGTGAIWLSPIHPADSYHGYDVTDYTAVNPEYGTMVDFENLVKAAHDKGIKVYLDYVVNHTGKGHSWYTDALEKGEQSAYWNYYHLSYNPAADVAAGKFPMVKSYSADDWKTPHGMTAPTASTHRYKFTLTTSNGKPTTVTVTKTEEPAQADNSDTSVNMFIYYGETGAAHRMYNKGNGVYELICDFNSPWGFLVRTSNSTWDGGTKYGGDGSFIEEGKPYTLNNSTAADIQFDYMRSIKVFCPIFSEWMPHLNFGEVNDLQNNAPYQQIIASAKGWLDKGVDGFRLDAAKHIYGIYDIDTRDYQFWTTFHNDLNAYYKTKPQYDGKDLYLVAEVYSGTNDVKGFAQYSPLSCFNFDYWWNVLPAGINGGNGRGIASGLKSIQDNLKSVNANYVDAVKMTNHDEDRAGSGLGGNVNRMRAAGMILQTVSGRPVVYYGEELGYTGIKTGTNDLYVRQPMKWSVTDYARFTEVLDVNFDSVKGVAELEGDEESILNAYRQFGQLRNIYPAMTNAGVMTPCYNSSSYPAPLAAYYREASGQKLLVLVNVGGQAINFSINDTVEKAVAVIGEVKRDEQKVTMAGFAAVVFKLK